MQPLMKIGMSCASHIHVHRSALAGASLNTCKMPVSTSDSLWSGIESVTNRLTSMPPCGSSISTIIAAVAMV